MSKLLSDLQSPECMRMNFLKILLFTYYQVKTIKHGKIVVIDTKFVWIPLEANAFYRTTLMHIAQYRYQDVCPSISQSVTCQYYVETAKYVIIFSTAW